MNLTSIAGVFGVKVSAEQQAKLEKLLEQLPGIVTRAQRLLSSQALQSGILSQPVPPHDPLRLPERHLVGHGFAHDFTETLGKPVTRGSIRNLGAARVTVILVGVEGERSAFPLLPGQVEETNTYVYAGVEISSDDEARILITAQ